MIKNKILELQNINLILDKNRILKDVSFELADGEIACLLGPSGCGKTSILRIIAGLEDRSSGNISINQVSVQNSKSFTPPEKRHVGMVFQDYALFPHMTVTENIAFGLPHLNKSQREQKINEMLVLTKLVHLKDSYPHKLSGGQQQRVALARALAQEPAILLFDEPFSSLDTELRYQLAQEIKDILKQCNTTAILVTHDQTEAFTFADKIAVMKEGEIQQIDSAFEIYHRPATPFVANFIGEGVVVNVELVEKYLNDKLNLRGLVLIRPEDIIYDKDSPIKATITKKFFRGSHFLYKLDFENGLSVLSLVQSHHVHNIGESIAVRIELEDVITFSEYHRGNDISSYVACTATR